MRFDIHMERDSDGHRYVQRITEIVPDSESPGRYRLNTIVEYRQGRYEMTGSFSKETGREIALHLGEEERQQFIEAYCIQSSRKEPVV